MVTRVRIEAEGRSPAEVERILQVAHEALVGADRAYQDAMFGSEMHGECVGYPRPGLVDAQAGELVIERFARDTDGEGGHGAIFYRGRMTAHYAKPSKTIDLRHRSTDDPYVPDNGTARTG